MVRICFEAGVPWVARGSGSGLSGGALPVEDGILIVLSRLRRILEVDLPNQRVVCERASRTSPSPTRSHPTSSTAGSSSQIVCSIGGNVAENSGGAHCFKYGFTTNYVTGLEIVLPDGELVQLGGSELDRRAMTSMARSWAPRARWASPRRSRCGSSRAPSASKPCRVLRRAGEAGRVVSEIVSAGIVPSAIEMMDRFSIVASEKMAGAGWPRRVPPC